MSSETFDTNGNFNSTTNYRYTAPVAGFYFFSGQVRNNGNATLTVYLYKNGAQYSEGTTDEIAAGFAGGVVVDMMSLAATDYVELWALSDNTTISTAYLSGFLISRT